MPPGLSQTCRRQDALCVGVAQDAFALLAYRLIPQTDDAGRKRLCFQ